MTDTFSSPCICTVVLATSGHQPSIVQVDYHHYSTSRTSQIHHLLKIRFEFLQPNLATVCFKTPKPVNGEISLLRPALNLKLRPLARLGPRNHHTKTSCTRSSRGIMQKEIPKPIKTRFSNQIDQSPSPR
jgi:hypothetical protein